jgi:hypothetical protein
MIILALKFINPSYYPYRSYIITLLNLLHYVIILFIDIRLYFKLKNYYK